MPPDQIFVCFVVVVMVGFFLWEKFAPDLVAMAALLLLFTIPFNGHPILWPDDSKLRAENVGAIFGNNAILTVMFLMVVTASLERTGLVAVLGRGFEKVAGKSDWRIMTTLWGMCL